MFSKGNRGVKQPAADGFAPGAESVTEARFPLEDDAQVALTSLDDLGMCGRSVDWARGDSSAAMARGSSR